MDIVFHNTQTGKKEIFTPLHKGTVSMYHCGPTVYDHAHIGNLRSSVTADILRRVFEYRGYEVKQVMNITDIEDKIIKKVREEHTTLAELTGRYEGIFLADLRHLNIKIPECRPHATHHIGGMITLIEKLLRDDYAYRTDDGIYFDITKSKGYGALAHIDLEAGTQRSRIASDEYDKKNPRDFALWKFWTKEDGENAFDASFGRGRPGWHIECSEMAMGELGETIDIHTGGVDLIFPHHTNEVAQSEAITGKPFVRYWLHHEHVMVDGQKMSKSLGNIITLKTVTERGFSPLAFRYLLLGTHYRSKANFTWEALEGAQNALRKLELALGEEVGTVNDVYRERFTEIISDDLDTPRALALVWEVVKDTNLSQSDKTATILDFDRVLGLGLAPRRAEVIPVEIEALVKDREEVRVAKNWAESDRLRGEIKNLGWEVHDTPEGQKINKI